MQKLNSAWTINEATQVYGIDRWGNPYFSINEQGNLSVCPDPEKGIGFDLNEIYQKALDRSIQFPVLVRFHDILRHRVRSIQTAFRSAIKEFSYQGSFLGVFPIKVNQMREVVEEILDAGKDFHLGLEVGSKPELFAALAVHQDHDSLIICNGYKDEDFIRTAIIGMKLNKKIILVVEKIEELARIVSISKSLQVKPSIGIRIRLMSKGSGKWALSGGEDAKFGLSTADLLSALEFLKQEDCSDSLQLLHFHVGSQITDIQTIKKAIGEATRYYAKLHHMGFPLKYIDVGGGLGIDYDGTRSSNESSTNYTLVEYTRDIVYNVMNICDEEKVPHPSIVSESGRATVAHHSILLVETFGTIEKTKAIPPAALHSDHKLVHDLEDILRQLQNGNRREALHDALQIKEEAYQRFNLGLLDLQAKAKIETLFWYLVESIIECYPENETLPEEVKDLSTQLADQFLCNFSVFQSLIDHWALDQLFPIMPIHRLEERPEHHATLVDITCDSDGKIDCFVDRHGSRTTIPLHAPNGKPYILGFFLVGAYQDVMGDIHNLFGPVTEMHIYMDADEPEGYYIEEIIPGSTIGHVLADVQYDPSQLARLMKSQIDSAIKSDLLKPSEGMKLLDQYEAGLNRSTYLIL